MHAEVCASNLEHIDNVKVEFTFLRAVEAETKTRWLDICAEVAVCEDPDRLAHLAKSIIEILQQEELRLWTFPIETLKLRN